mmetsp:Transcript_21190/g.51181  ORF Transcript_21190/g.51181 Transcript_21190/m.51181 type:complete len:218 (+) Transcript_21190:837-1490(+)
MARILAGRVGQRAHFHGHFREWFDAVPFVVPFLVGAVELVVAHAVGPSFFAGHFGRYLDYVLEDVGEGGEDEAASVPSEQRGEGVVVRPLLLGLLLIVADGGGGPIVIFITAARSVGVGHLHLALPRSSAVVGQRQRLPFADDLGGLGVQLRPLGDLLDAYELAGCRLPGESLSDLGQCRVDYGRAVVGVGNDFGFRRLLGLPLLLGRRGFPGRLRG